MQGFSGGAEVPDLATLNRFLVGVDVDDSEEVWRVCQTVDFHGGRNWTVEIALWDLLARRANQPLWRLLGGESDSYRIYQSTAEQVGPEERADRLLTARAAGVEAAKIRFHSSDWRADLPLVEKARNVLGPEFALMVDANQGWRMPGDTRPAWTFATASACARALSDLGITWLEEPLATDDLNGYRRLRSLRLVPIAAGEMVRDLAATRSLLETVDVIQNDVVLAGGVHGCRQVAGWASELGRSWSPHTWSTGYGLLANLHVALAWSTCPYLEFPYDPPGWTYERRDFMLPEPLTIAGGRLKAPEGPGLGYEPDFALLERWRIA